MCKDCGCGEDNGVVTKVFTVPGMMCNNCKETVEGATLGLEVCLALKSIWQKNQLRFPLIHLR